MLPPTWMIEELERRRREREERERPQLSIDLPLPLIRRDERPDRDVPRGPIVIEL